MYDALILSGHRGQRLVTTRCQAVRATVGVRHQQMYMCVRLRRRVRRGLLATPLNPQRTPRGTGTASRVVALSTSGDIYISLSGGSAVRVPVR